jgi:hypothetical protein
MPLLGVKFTVFEAKSREIGHTKTAQAANVKTFSEMVFVLCG